MRFLRLALLGLLVFAFDYVSKALAAFFIQPIQYCPSSFPFGGIAIFHNFLGIDFCINHVSNHGAAWGIFSSMQEWLLVFRIAVIAGLFIYMVRSHAAKAYLFPLTLIVAGAVGNVVDYFIYGHVVDMFHFIFWGYDYPVFNVADTAIFLGMVWILIASYTKEKHERKIAPES